MHLQDCHSPKEFVKWLEEKVGDTNIYAPETSTNSIMWNAGKTSILRAAKEELDEDLNEYEYYKTTNLREPYVKVAVGRK